MPEQAHTIERAAYLRRRKRQKRWVLLAQLGIPDAAIGLAVAGNVLLDFL